MKTWKCKLNPNYPNGKYREACNSCEYYQLPSQKTKCLFGYKTSDNIFKKYKRKQTYKLAKYHKYISEQ